MTVPVVKKNKPKENKMNLSTLSAETRDELDSLSKELFRSTSRWQTLLKNGLVETVTDEVEEYIPAEFDAEGKEVKAEETRKVKVPVAYKNSKKSVLMRVRRFDTVEEVRTYLLDCKKQFDAIKEIIRKRQEEQKAAQELAQQKQAMQRELAGSATT